jgi:carboxymethylenebutenolidase
MAEFIELTAADGFKFPAYQARPIGTPRGALVVLSEIFGVNSHICAVTEAYAAQGYVVLAPATFHRVQAGVELGYTPKDVAAGVELKKAVECLSPPGVMQDIQATIVYAAKFGRVGVLGFCWGGLLTWRSACLLEGITAAVPFYGGGMTSPAEAARQPHCPVLAHFGDQDQSIPLAGVDAFKRAHPQVDVRVYEAGHGFSCDHRGAFNAVAAAQAREVTLKFFATHVG